MNIFLRNISPDDIASVNYEEVPGSTQLDGEAEVVLTTDGDTAMVDIPVNMLQQTTINTPMLLRITTTNNNTIDVNLVYMSGSWNDEVDVVADEVRNEDGKNPSLHEAFGVVLIGQPSLYETEARREEEECYCQDAVVVIIHEFLHELFAYSEVYHRYDRLVEDYKDREETADLLAQDPVEECLLVGRSSLGVYQQQCSEESQTDVKDHCKIHFGFSLLFH